MLDEAEKVTATEANRNFSQLFRRAKGGETIVITDHGEDAVVIGPVARPSDEESAKWAAEKEEARKRFIEKLRSQPALNLVPWTRDELYDEVIG